MSQDTVKTTDKLAKKINDLKRNEQFPKIKQGRFYCFSNLTRKKRNCILVKPKNKTSLQISYSNKLKDTVNNPRTAILSPILR